MPTSPAAAAVRSGHAAVAGGAGDARPGGRWRAADDRRAARRDLRQQPECAAHTSNVSEAQAEAKQKQLAREKQQQDAINSDTVAIDFAAFRQRGSCPAPTTTAVLGERQEASSKATGETDRSPLPMPPAKKPADCRDGCRATDEAERKSRPDGAV